MTFQPPIAKGVVSAFNEILKDMYNVLLINNMYQSHEELPAEYKELLEMYSKLTENSTEDECFQIIKLLKDFPVKEGSVENCDEPIKDFYQHFRKFRDLVERKITLPLQEWNDIKWDLMHFSETYEKLQQQLDDVRLSLEKIRFLKDKEMSEQETGGKHERKMDLASEDFKSLQPFSIRANSEEHMGRISTLKEKKLQVLKDKLKLTEKALLQNIKAKRKEIQSITQECIETKSFTEWIEQKNYVALKDLEAKIKEEWNAFSSEMDSSRNLGKMYAEKHAIYLDIKRQEDAEERLEKQDGAATLLQAHWRGYMARRRLRGDSIF